MFILFFSTILPTYVSPIAGGFSAGEASSVFLIFLSLLSDFAGGGGGSGRFRSARIGRAEPSKPSSLVGKFVPASPLGKDDSGTALSATVAALVSSDIDRSSIIGAFPISGFEGPLVEPPLSSLVTSMSPFAVSTLAGAYIGEALE